MQSKGMANDVFGNCETNWNITSIKTLSMDAMKKNASHVTVLKMCVAYKLLAINKTDTKNTSYERLHSLSHTVHNQKQKQSRLESCDSWVVNEIGSHGEISEPVERRCTNNNSKIRILKSSLQITHVSENTTSSEFVYVFGSFHFIIFSIFELKLATLTKISWIPFIYLNIGPNYLLKKN